jgi:hypothetical protein
LRRRRMRLNFGVRLRDQPCRQEHRSSVGFLAAAGPTLRFRRSRRLTSWSSRQVAEQQHRAAAASGLRRLAATHLRGTGFYCYTPAAPDGADDELLSGLRQPTAAGYPAQPTSGPGNPRGGTDLQQRHATFGPPSTSGVTHPRGGQFYCCTLFSPGATADKRLNIEGGRYPQTRSRAAARHASEVQQCEPRTRSPSGTPRASRCAATASPNVALQPTCGARLRRGGGVASAPHAAELWR